MVAYRISLSVGRGVQNERVSLASVFRQWLQIRLLLIYRYLLKGCELLGTSLRPLNDLEVYECFPYT